MIDIDDDQIEVAFDAAKLAMDHLVGAVHGVEYTFNAGEYFATIRAVKRHKDVLARFEAAVIELAFLFEQQDAAS